MGWDVVQLGLKHDLPIDDPQATAQVLARRMGCDVQVGYYKYCEYDEAEQRVYSIPSAFVPLGTPHRGGSSAPSLRLVIGNYWADELNQRIAPYGLSEIDFEETWIRSFLLEGGNDYQLYTLESDDNEDGNAIEIRIFKETVNLALYAVERWSAWARHFESTDEEHWLRLQEYRMQVYERAKVFGCEQVLYFADQGPTELIYDDMDKGAEELLAYVHTRRYLDDSSWIEPEDQEIWRRDGLHIQYADYFKGNIPWREGVWIEVVFDDFSDLKEAECPTS
jgi:hypothetical protein